MMKKVLLGFLSLVPYVLMAQIDVDSIYLWDNDRGVYKMMYPAVAALPTRVHFAWQDGRYSTYDIFRGRWQWPNTWSPEVQVIEDPYDSKGETYPDADGFFTPNYDIIYCWRSYNQKTLYNYLYARWEKNWSFGSVIFIDSSVFSLYSAPSISCRDNGEFIVSYSSKFLFWSTSNVHYKRYYSNGTFRDSATVRATDSVWLATAKVAYCDSGFVVVYEDSSADGTLRSIYLQCRKTDGTIIANRIKVSRYGLSDSYNETEPDVAINKWGYGAVVWKDLQYGVNDPDIRGVTFQIRPGLNQISITNTFSIDITSRKSRAPKVTMIHQDPNATPNNDIFVVWEEDTSAIPGEDTIDIKGRARINNTLKTKFRVSYSAYRQDRWPDVDCRNSDTAVVVWSAEYYDSAAKDVWHTLSLRYCYYYPSTDTGVRFYSGQMNPIPLIGESRAWYYDDENYDNPLTTDWNEDPIDEVDSIYCPLDSAVEDQIEELNRNNQYRVVNRDTLPRGKAGLMDYDHLIMDLGYRGEGKTAGIISSEDKNTIVDFINAGKPVIVFGNDFGKMYNGDTLFKLFHANYLGDGAEAQYGNIDTLYGVAGTFTYGETLLYTYKEAADNCVDSISAKPEAKLLLKSSGAPTEWYAGRCVGWGNYWKGENRAAGSTIYASFSAAGIKDRHHPHTYAEFIRRCFGFLRVACPPEPITAIYCSTYTAAEGSIIIRWKVVSDDSLTESAAGPYKLKFSRKKITSETAFNDSCEEYYQTWNTKDSTVGKWCRYILEGLPPMDTLIFALKVSDEDTLWGALGAEPRVVVSGDSMTPHYLKVGSVTNPYGYVKDFSNKYEYINRRRKNDTGTDYDSLFVTWDYPMSPPWFYVGFARCNLYTEGDLFIYVDTRPGGADSTVPYNGTSGRSAFKPTPPDSFKPDFCLIVDNGSTISYKRYVSTKDGRGSWSDTTFSGLVCEDGVVNNYLYTELYIPYANMGYTAGNPFKLVVLMTGETSNTIINAFPIFNPLGTYKNITQYYWWGSNGLTSGKVPARKDIIGIEETSLNPKSQIRNPKLTVHPNPFTEKTEIFLPSVDVPGRDASLKIYDITGRLVKSFNLSTLYSLLATSIIWDGTDDNGRNVAQGIYFCKFAIPERTEVEKIIYLK